MPGIAGAPERAPPAGLEPTVATIDRMLDRPARPRWPDQAGFIVAALGATLGLGAFTSFPARALEHGGGAFLLAYLIAVATAALPVLVLEFGVGQCYQAAAPEGLRRLDRRLEWLGWWATGLAALAALANVAQLTWTALYAGDSLVALAADRPLPWGADAAGAATWFSARLQEPVGDAGLAALAPVGTPVVVLALIWLLLHRIMAGGVASIGRWCLWSVPAAVALLVALGIGVLYQPGAVEGAAAYLVPRWAALGEGATWLGAYREAFVTHALGLGVYVAYASHLNRGADATGSAAVVALAGAAFAFLAGLVACAAAGALAAGAGVPLDAVVLAGPRATFAAFPAFIAGLDLPPWGSALMALLLFLDWFLLAIGTVIGLVAAVTLAVADKWSLSWRWLNARLCLAGFFAALVLATSHGPRLVEILHEGLFPFGVAVAVAAQCLALARVSGGVNLQRHLNAYSVIAVGRGWRAMVAAVTPAALLGVAIEGARRLAGADTRLAWEAATAGAVAGALALAAALSLAVLPGRRLP